MRTLSLIYQLLFMSTYLLSEQFKFKLMTTFTLQQGMIQLILPFLNFIPSAFAIHNSNSKFFLASHSTVDQTEIKIIRFYVNIFAEPLVLFFIFGCCFNDKTISHIKSRCYKSRALTRSLLPVSA